MMMVPALNPAILSSLISPPKVSGLTFSRVTEASLAPAFAIEEASYPADEAATEEKPPAEEPDLLKPADFEKRLREVREARESDLREVSNTESKEDSLSELGADLSSKV